jgi:hypothetical protein
MTETKEKTDLRGVWRHYKGHTYEVLGVAKHSESLVELVTYRNIETGEMWARPVEIFLSPVETGDAVVETIPRFTRLTEGFSNEDRILHEDVYIDAAHPTETKQHDLYTEAMRLVGAKHSKYGLVDLVNWLLFRIKCLEALHGRPLLYSQRQMIDRGDLKACEESGRSAEKYVEELQKFHIEHTKPKLG